MGDRYNNKNNKQFSNKGYNNSNDRYSNNNQYNDINKGYNNNNSYKNNNNKNNDRYNNNTQYNDINKGYNNKNNDNKYNNNNSKYNQNNNNKFNNNKDYNNNKNNHNKKKEDEEDEDNIKVYDIIEPEQDDDEDNTKLDEEEIDHIFDVVSDKKIEFTIDLEAVDYSDLSYYPSFKKKFLIQETEYELTSSKDFTILNDNTFDDEDNLQEQQQIVYLPDSKIPVASNQKSNCLPKEVKLFFDKTEFTEPTLFQKYAWPAILTGHDVIGTSLPGSGKTIGYLAPMISHVLDRMANSEKDIQDYEIESNIFSLILVPTRELGVQVYNNFKIITKFFGIRALPIYGGVAKQPQIQSLKKINPHVLISTPGRLIEMVYNQRVDLRSVSMLVLDEADKMLSKGLLPQLKQIKTQIRPDSQNILFSATFSESMRDIAKDWIKEPHINLKIGSMELPNLKHITQEVQFHAHHKKPRALVKVLESAELEKKKTIVFFNKIKELKRISIMCLKSNIKHQTIFGNIDQEKRETLINNFKSSRNLLLFSTDVIGRGIHVDDIQVIINYDFPKSLEQYCHRVGRAGRTKKAENAKAISFFTNTDSFLAKAFVNFLTEQGQKPSVPFLKQCNERIGTNFELVLSKRKEKELKKKRAAELEKLLQDVDESDSDSDLDDKYKKKYSGSESESESEEEKEEKEEKETEKKENVGEKRSFVNFDDLFKKNKKSKK
ncbi:hypothetical protein CYY_006101 [Polysphondylium violaceum]|uniref:RNA helicase n=1 Tax=Polysphondylium violaceum TaxID=133409 RepID=A0A8J4PRV8_9MYCE|nr:hypothetical protein CYY_006101 [Polysphondylium violaceum]